MVHDTGRQADGWWVASKYCGGPWRVVGTEKRNIRGQSLIAKEIPAITQILSTILSRARKTCVKLMQRLLGMEVEKARVCWRRCWGSWGIAQLYRGWRWGLLGRDKHPQLWVHLRDPKGGTSGELKSYRSRGCLTALKANVTQFAHRGGEAWNVLVTYLIQFSETPTGWVLTTLF